jgi:predicted AAA+ superfamily ATPase
MSSTNISNYLKSQKGSMTHDTILDYLSFAEDAMFLSKVNRQDIRGKEVLKTDYKFYLEDHGFRRAIGFDNMGSIDQVLENIVYNELKRRGYDVTIGKGVNSEVDFVADIGTKREYYQVTYLMQSEDTRKREFGALSKIKDNHPKFVLSLDEFCTGCEGIEHVNIIEWLSNGM